MPFPRLSRDTPSTTTALLCKAMPCPDQPWTVPLRIVVKSKLYGALIPLPVPPVSVNPIRSIVTFEALIVMPPPVVETSCIK